ncbi:response regulator [Candidatus Magnetominusculus xianensis]|uniref:Response regulator receiver protein n=1 Tax=Candidatus Magnetominusculus xianensis TaxID=1748249 RepID=A0ABR5SCG6_9BACT|nr:response regulator [Candidatus Magnetominusculus xianensis]KWT76806.1 response regulator receiver protein [Candidatus Magnetominusculus xianensis]MBF0402688.1 response regulator [Nitrospirota bacterium]
MKILVVEDDFLNRKLVSEILRRSGYTVLAASNAGDGIRIAKEQQPALVLMDIDLHALNDGLSAAKQLKQDDTTKHINVVAITDYTNRGTEMRIYDAGCDAYVANPISCKALLDTISSFVK